MKNKKTFVVKLKRKREGKTNYNKRIKLLLSETPRIVIRRSLKNISVQIIEYNTTGDKVIVSAHTKELEKQGWKASKKNIPAAYLCGMLAAKKAISKGIKKVIVDFGVYTPIKGSKLYAAVKGALAGGLEISIDEKILPSQERLEGKHIQKFPNNFEEIKNKLMK